MMTNQKVNSQKSIVIFTIGMLLTKFSSFLVNIALSYKYGTSVTSDAVIISMNIPTIIFTGFVSAISLCYVPLYKEAEIHDSLKRNEITSILINTLFVIFSIVCIFLFLYPKIVIRLFAGGMESEGIDLACKLTRWVAIATIFVSTTGILQGFLQANNRFRLVSISVLPINLITSLSVLISNKQSVDWYIGLGFVLSYYFQFLLFFIEARKLGWKWSPEFNYKNHYIKKLFIMVIPVLLGTILYDINSIVDKSFASQLSSGSISVLDYSYKVAAAAQGILAYPLTTIIYTKLSEESSKKDIKALTETVNNGISRLSFFMIPTITGLIALSEEIIRILFFRGNFDVYSVKITSDCLIIYLVGMYAISFRALIEKVFYSMQLTKITLSNTLITVVSNVAMNLLLYRKLGCYGLAIATSISLVISLVFLSLFMRTKIKIIIRRKTIVNTVKIIISSVIMMIVVITSNGLFHDTSFVGTLIKTLVLAIEGALIYILLLYFTKEENLSSLLNKKGEKYDD